MKLRYKTGKKKRIRVGDISLAKNCASNGKSKKPPDKERNKPVEYVKHYVKVDRYRVPYVDWDDIDGRPNQYPPIRHKHLVSDILDFGEYAHTDHKHTWDDIYNKPDKYRPEEHSHRWDEIDGKPYTYPSDDHRHKWGEIDGKPSEYKPSAHPHSWGEIENKPDAYRPLPHRHNFGEINLPPELETLLYILGQGKPGQVLTKTSTGVRWRDYEQTVIHQHITMGSVGGSAPSPEPEPEEDDVIIDSEGTFLVDSEGTFITAT